MLYACAAKFDVTKTLFRYTQKPKTLQDSSSHQILRHMHETLNINKKDN